MAGTYIDSFFNGKEVKAFLPDKPPLAEELTNLTQWSERIATNISALTTLGRYASISSANHAILHLESMSTSSIEGVFTESSTQLMVSAGLIAPTSEKTNETKNTLDAQKLLAAHEGPINSFLLRSLHQELCRGATTISAKPGEFKTQPNKVGNHYPPPPHLVADLMHQWSDYANTPEGHPLLHALLTHYWFEAIHPFADGNGRIGRLILSKMIMRAYGNNSALFPISLGIAGGVNRYHRGFQAIQRSNDYAPFLTFMTTAAGVSSLALGRIIDAHYVEVEKLKRDHPSWLVELLAREPVVSAKQVATHLKVNIQTARRALIKQVEAKNLREVRNPADKRQVLYFSDAMLKHVFQLELTDQETALVKNHAPTKEKRFLLRNNRGLRKL